MTEFRRHPGLTVEKAFWTGGSESTFWILRILDESDYFIEPHYVVDPARSSAALEIRTMEELRRHIEAFRPDWAGRIGALQITHLDQIPEAQDLADAYQAIRGEWYIGLQYLWLAAYCRTVGGPIDLCVGNNGRLGQTLEREVVRSDGELENYELRATDPRIATLFGNFRLPVIHVNKSIMHAEAARRGWTPILNRTWFCHQPVAGRYTCGTCRPCVYMMDWGQSSRLDWVGQLRFHTIERAKRMLPQGLKDKLRSRAGQSLKRFLRA